MKTKTNTISPVASSSGSTKSKRGAAAPVATLRRQAWNFLELARIHSHALSRAWSPELTLALAASLERFEKSLVDSVRERDASKQSTATLQRHFAEAVLFRDQLGAALRRLALRRPGAVNPVHLMVGKATKNPVLLAGWFAAVQPAVEQHQAELAQQLGSDPVQKVLHHHGVLLGAATQQLTARRGLKEQTSRLREVRNQLVESIDDLQLAARVVFAGQRSVLQAFRKGIVRRPKAVVKAVASEESEVASQPVAEAPAAAAA